MARSSPQRILKLKLGNDALLLRLLGDVSDPRKARGKRYLLPNLLLLVIAATLCGSGNYKEIALWARSPTPTMRRRFGCPVYKGRCHVPSVSCLRSALMAVDPDGPGQALDGWGRARGWIDDVVSADGKTICAARDGDGRQPHILGTFGHDSLTPLSNARTLTGETTTRPSGPTRSASSSGWSTRSATSQGPPSPWTPCSRRGGSRPVFSDAAPTT